MNLELFKDLLQQKASFQYTTDQQVVIEKLHRLLFDKNERILIIRGYAGTGKTSLIGSLIKSSQQIGRTFVLLAPTGRAAKVQTQHTKQIAYTIHKKIYKRTSDDDTFTKVELQYNTHKNCIFIVDEASMIPDWQSGENQNSQSGRSLLDDLFAYVFSGFNCKLILMGDNAQLPPIGSNKSPALEKTYVESNWSFATQHVQLREVVRQATDSSILLNATQLRLLLLQKEMPAKIPLSLDSDFIAITGYELEDTLNSAYSKYGAENVLVLCRSNKTANQYNQQIRARIKWLESDIAAGDYLMIVKNNYSWLPKESKIGFIANGDIIQIERVSKQEEKYGLKFANVVARFIDYENEPEMEFKIILDVLTSNNASLEAEQQKKLYYAVLEDYMHITSKKERLRAVKEDPYFNALQVKFAYAITCHKSQGGQWKQVFIDHGFLNPENYNFEFIRWLYTAITRATEKVYLINFNQNYFELNDN
ncbi:MAG: AAA family ATPase [Bacteroidetes bacterium]|nr:AAA family ATPase [Bacteroidota bacterium]